jgi:uncharacterized protein YecE (DUF72 family)
MDFGKIKGARKIDFAMPSDDAATARILSGLSLSSPLKTAGDSTSTQPRFFIGGPLWQDDDMARRLCPPRTPKSKRLNCYSRQFNAVELNSTGYGMDAARVRQWAGEVAPGFLFCPKVPMDISHGRDLDKVWDLYARHCEAAEGFGEHLGLSFLQFPESFGTNRLPELELFLKTHAARLPLAVEVRHPQWFADRDAKGKLFALLEAHGIPAVITDTPGRRDVLHQRLTTSTAFIRFNGYPLGGKDHERLDAWAERVRTWLAQGLKTLYFFVHLAEMDDLVDLAAYFIAALNRACGLNLAEPKLQIEVENLSLFG